MITGYGTDGTLRYETSCFLTCLRYIEYPRSRTVIFVREPIAWFTGFRGRVDWSRESDTVIFEHGALSTCNRILESILQLFHKENRRYWEPKQPQIMIHCFTGSADEADVAHNKQLAEKMNIRMNKFVEDIKYRVVFDLYHFEPCVGGMIFYANFTDDYMKHWDLIRRTHQVRS
jgi:hypothetical protein